MTYEDFIERYKMRGHEEPGYDLERMKFYTVFQGLALSDAKDDVVMDILMDRTPWTEETNVEN